jgi:hypothetical protein
MDLPDKSDRPKDKPPPKNIKPLVTSGVKKATRPATRRFFDFLLAESPKDLVRRTGREILVPRAKAAVEEALNSFLHGMFWGNSQPPPSQLVRGTVLRGGGINYSQQSTQMSGLQQARQALPQQQHWGNYQDLVCETQQMAEFILANLFETINNYNVVTVADLYEMANITPSPSDGSYGWTNLDTARISKVRNGYSLELPKPYLI